MDTQFQTDWVTRRSAELVDKSRLALHRSADSLFHRLGVLQYAAAVVIAMTPPAWLGTHAFSNTQALIALSLGGLLTVAACLTSRMFSGSPVARHVMAVCQMGWSILFMYLAGARIETHFHVFASLALLSFYRDWKILVTASAIVAADLWIRGFWFPSSVFGVESGIGFRCLEYLVLIVFTDIFLAFACLRANRLELQLCRRQAELEQTNKNVEEIVWARTKDLKEANRKLKGEVKTRVRAETEREKLTRKLIQASRQAGLSEVATGVLHSVGNVLNSINVSADTILDRLDECRIDRLREAVSMIQSSPEETAPIFVANEKRQQVAQYLSMAMEKLNQQHTDIHQEIVSMRGNVAHVVELVTMQQAYASVGGVNEEFSVQDVCEDAININLSEGPAKDIEIVREYGDLPLICTERHRVLQIVVNLISNSKNAVIQPGVSSRRITIKTEMTDSKMILVRVKDSGIGIAEQNLQKVFQHGFTTRNEGHGFGLHSCVLTAHELNGNLECFSEGEGYGAEFVLSLPITEVPIESTNGAKFFIPSHNLNRLNESSLVH